MLTNGAGPPGCYIEQIAGVRPCAGAAVDGLFPTEGSGGAGAEVSLNGDGLSNKWANFIVLSV